MENRNLFNTKFLIYLMLYGLGLFITIFLDKNSFEIWQSISMFSFASIAYILLYLGLKLKLYRLNGNDRLRIFIEKIRISKRALIIHFFIIFFALGVAIYMDDSNRQSVIRNEKINSEVINAINKEFGRKDITKIIRTDNKYVITFSDGSLKVFEFIENNQ